MAKYIFISINMKIKICFILLKVKILMTSNLVITCSMLSAFGNDNSYALSWTIGKNEIAYCTYVKNGENNNLLKYEYVDQVLALWSIAHHHVYS